MSTTPFSPKATAEDTPLGLSSLVDTLKKRTVLVVEDNQLNRELLASLLEGTYEVIEASNGEEGLKALSSNLHDISVVLLDMFMPVCDGFEFLQRVRDDALLSTIPIIVTTGSSNPEDEVRCLQLGAADFVSKPYNPQVVLGRIESIIRLHESVATLSAVEYDELTGLYTMQAFCHYAELLMKDAVRSYDMSVSVIRGASLLNRIHGRAKVNEYVAFQGRLLRYVYPHTLIARDGTSIYMLFPSDRRLPLETLQQYCNRSMPESPLPDVSYSLGLYQDVDKTQPVAVLCDRALMAAKTLANDYSQSVALFDKTMEERLTQNQQLEARFKSALENNEFKVWLQPKVSVLTGRIESAEALVRWIDAEGAVVSPSVFIPLFENDGLISALDEYMFKAVCRIQRAKIEEGKPLVPISVNLSRNSIFISDILDRYLSIAQQEHVPASLVPLEITESAASEDNRVLDVCKAFSEAGFVLHMDDFGAGYSSLHALATFPFSALKLDKQMVDHIGTKSGDIVVRNVINIAQDLGMNTIAEGVETPEQLEFLANAGCDTIQGFFFAPPMKCSLFDSMLAQETPFGNDSEIQRILTSELGNLTVGELRHYLKAYRAVFPLVRVVDSKNQISHLSDENGELDQTGNPCFELWSRHERCENCIAQQALTAGGTVQKFEVHHNEVCLVIAKYFEIEGEPHVIEMLNHVGNDVLHGFQKDPAFIEAINSINQELYRDVQLDIYNRRFFEERMDLLEDITAVAMLDVDNFKEINDTQGHHVGDLVLRAVANAVKDNIRKTDVLIRYGGDEMLIAYSGMKQEFFFDRLESVRKAVEAISFPDYPNVKATISIGGYFCQAYSPQAIIVADREMYVAKQMHNRISIQYPEDEA